MTELMFEYLLRTTPPDELKRQMREFNRWLKWQIWREQHLYLAALFDTVRSGGAYGGLR